MWWEVRGRHPSALKEDFPGQRMGRVRGSAGKRCCTLFGRSDGSKNDFLVMLAVLCVDWGQFQVPCTVHQFRMGPVGSRFRAVRLSPTWVGVGLTGEWGASY